MKFQKIIFTVLIVFCIAYSDENRNFSLTLEGFDAIHIGAGINKNKFHMKFKLGLDYTRNNYQNVITENEFTPTIGVNFGLLTSPSESVELIPAIGLNFYTNLDWLSGDPDGNVYYSFKFGPNANLTVYKLFKSFIIGGSVNLCLFTFERVEKDNWNKSLNVTFKPHFIIGFRF